MAAIKGVINGSTFLKTLGFTLYYMDDGTVSAQMSLEMYVEGPPAHMHGGAIATILDEAMGAAAHLGGYLVVAARLTFNYKRAVPLGVPVRVRAWVDRVENRKVYGASEIILPDDTVAVMGEGLFIQAPSFFDTPAFQYGTHNDPMSEEGE